MTSDFELRLVKAFNNFFRSSRVPGIAYRFRQYKYAAQFVDILVDSPQGYLGIEAKRLSPNSKSLYFSQFSTSSGGSQLERIQQFLELSGRRGYLAVELPARISQAWLLDWNQVFQAFRSGDAGLSLDSIQRTGLRIPKLGREYCLNSRLWRRLIGRVG